MDKKQVRQYRDKLYQRSLRETLAGLDIKGERMKLIIQIVLGSLILGFTSGLSFLGIKGYENFQSGVFALVIGTVVTAVAVFAGLSLGAKIIARVNIFRVAATIDLEQREALESYEDKMNFVDVDFKFSEWQFSEQALIYAPTIFDGYVTPSNINKMAGIRVQIPEGSDIRCYGAISSLVRINTDGSQDDLYGEATRNGSLISWSGGGENDEGEVLIKDGTERILNIADGVNRDLIFRLLNLSFFQNSNGLYVFGVEFGGRILGKKIKSKTAYFHIIYDTSTTAMDGYEEYTPGSFRKLEIKKGKPSAALTKKKSSRKGTLGGLS